jgi:hypothetical protein
VRVLKDRFDRKVTLLRLKNAQHTLLPVILREELRRGITNPDYLLLALSAKRHKCRDSRVTCWITTHSVWPRDLSAEREEQVKPKIAQLIAGLRQKSKKSAPQKVARRCQILWHLYFGPDKHRVRRVAASFQVVPSTVSFLKGDFEKALQKMNIRGAERGAFLKVLETKLRTIGFAS